MSDELRDEQLSRLYREAAGSEPPEALDRTILAAARAEAAPAKPRRRAWWQTWAGPASVAATLVLTVTLTLMVQQEQELPASAAPSVKTDAADFAVKPAAPSAKAKQEAAPREAARAPEAPRSEPEGAPVAKPFTGEMKALPAAPASAAAPPLPSLPPPPPAPAAEPLESGVPAQPAATLRRQAAPATDVAADAVEARAKSAPLRKEAAGAAMTRSPGQWLEDIRQLKQQGKEKEAAESLADFRKAYPDYRLPGDLR